MLRLSDLEAMSAPASLSIVVPVLDEAAMVVAVLGELAPLRARGVEVIGLLKV